MTKGEAHALGLIRDCDTEQLHWQGMPGYYVEYEDGYKSWSPASVFEKSYKVAETIGDRILNEEQELREKIKKLAEAIKNVEMTEPHRNKLRVQLNAMVNYQVSLLTRKMMDSVVTYNFDMVLFMLKDGYVLTRQAWRRDNKMIFRQVPQHCDENVIPKMTSLPERVRGAVLETAKNIYFADQCLVFNALTGHTSSWVPTVEDLFATDWEVVV